MHRRPTAGHVAIVDNVRITVLTPNVRLRHQFVTHGVDENNASIVLRVEFPASRVVRIGGTRRVRELQRIPSLLLGADAQFEAWAHSFTDFPEMRTNGEARRRELRQIMEPDRLRAHVFKVPHHASKNGVHLELAERVGAPLTLVSCADGTAPHHFPHEIARAALRAARGQLLGDPVRDDELGIHYTGASDTLGRPLGTICVAMNQRKREVWRFGDTSLSEIDPTTARRHA